MPQFQLRRGKKVLPTLLRWGAPACVGSSCSNPLVSQLEDWLGFTTHVPQLCEFKARAAAVESCRPLASHVLWPSLLSACKVRAKQARSPCVVFLRLFVSNLRHDWRFDPPPLSQCPCFSFPEGCGHDVEVHFHGNRSRDCHSHRLRGHSYENAPTPNPNPKRTPSGPSAPTAQRPVRSG